MTYGLKARMTDGMFPNEAILEFRDAAGKAISIIASRSLIVHLSGRSAIVRVRILDSGNGLRMIELPGEVFGSGRQVTVRETELEPMPV